MAKAAKKKPTSKKKPAKPSVSMGRRVRRYAVRAILGVVAFFALLIIVFRFAGPPTTHTIWSESRRLGGVEWDRVAIEDIAPSAVRAVVAAEDADFCGHWGFDMSAIRDAIEDGGQRGASTISQQTVKNVFLWQGRSWMRKATEALLTPAVEAIWPKRRIIEVYLNIAEFGEGVFGVEAAAQHYFGVSAADLTPAQGARLAVVLPNPKERNAARLPPWLQKHAARVQDGAATIKADGRASCFES